MGTRDLKGKEKAQRSRERRFLEDFSEGEIGVRQVGRPVLVLGSAKCPAHSSCKQPPVSIRANPGKEGLEDHMMNETPEATLSLDFILRTMGSITGFIQNILGFAV